MIEAAVEEVNLLRQRSQERELDWHERVRRRAGEPMTQEQKKTVEKRRSGRGADRGRAHTDYGGGHVHLVTVGDVSGLVGAPREGEQSQSESQTQAG